MSKRTGRPIVFGATHNGQDACQVLVEETILDKLYNETRPLDGRPGWRIDDEGRQWYSSVWLNERQATS